MSLDTRRRSLLLLGLLSPAARASSYLVPSPANNPVDLIRRLFDEVLASPRQRTAEAKRQGN